ncbi:uncharacterized protein LOC143848595 [Tasmannia lanceolata]|uniref:uncharacterized protein LOC143848595 n=1 Tax=Tasmannia lanceolata TaxID=3420 RepID=UPI004063A60A
MVSFQNSSSLGRETFPRSENSGKKRKHFDGKDEEDDMMNTSKRSKEEIVEPTTCNIELHLEGPLPLEWQRCLDLKSGQIHFYNMRTHKRTCRDPRQSPETPTSKPMSLDLELNLPCDPLDSPGRNSSDLSKEFKQQRNHNSSGLLSRSSSWASLEGDREEMVAAVCMRCHMLVMLHKSSPVCPNCKFMHPITQNPLSMFKPKLRLVL